jgi:hypothetical protein
MVGEFHIGAIISWDCPFTSVFLMSPIEDHPAVISDEEISSGQTIRYIQIRRGVNIYLPHHLQSPDGSLLPGSFTGAAAPSLL